ncbi:hypothetical protein GGX14DRAFT_576285 [Mycena pura]|uniref:Uncharacterized protein n=1 Tax=Mycena pura TaxID=153505 RepID=A0AAD6V0X1_9AGAR|nr:hypothetical protein GGX14DRAFT_576285 [Mycena pura]
MIFPSTLRRGPTSSTLYAFHRYHWHPATAPTITLFANSNLSNTSLTPARPMVKLKLKLERSLHLNHWISLAYLLHIFNPGFKGPPLASGAETARAMKQHETLTPGGDKVSPPRSIGSCGAASARVVPSPPPFWVDDFRPFVRSAPSENRAAPKKIMVARFAFAGQHLNVLSDPVRQSKRVLDRRLANIQAEGTSSFARTASSHLNHDYLLQICSRSRLRPHPRSLPHARAKRPGGNNVEPAATAAGSDNEAGTGTQRRRSCLPLWALIGITMCALLLGSSPNAAGATGEGVDNVLGVGCLLAISPSPVLILSFSILLPPSCRCTP